MTGGGGFVAAAPVSRRKMMYGDRGKDENDKLYA